MKKSFLFNSLLIFSTFLIEFCLFWTIKFYDWPKNSKIKENFQFLNWVLAFSNWVLAFLNWVLAFLTNWVFAKKKHPKKALSPKWREYVLKTNLWLESLGIHNFIPVFSWVNLMRPTPQMAVRRQQARTVFQGWRPTNEP